MADPRYRTMAEVLRDESMGCFCNFPRLYGHRVGCPAWLRVERASAKRRAG